MMFVRGLCCASFITLLAASPEKPVSKRIDPVVQGEAITELPAAMKKRLLASCFEVVVPKPVKDSLTYEKPLPWEQLPFHIRNDKYYSIGTAFAVSATELVTAFHVLDLHQELLSFPQYFIRDAEQNVYEIDQIVLAHEHRDVVRFTVKGRTFSQWLDLEPSFEMNRPVFTAGNAYGEGIVVRRGELIGTLPEAMDGAWSWLKSSADVNAGNSGGPLLNASGRVIGVVTQRKDNMSYSLPVAEMQKLKPSEAGFYNKITYSFNLFPEKSGMTPSAFAFPLPMHYRELRKKAYQTRHATYARDMEGLFAAQKELFPKGDSSLEVLYDIPTSTFLEMVFKDPNSNRWAMTDVKTNTFELGANGKLVTAMNSGLLTLWLREPDDLAYSDLVEKPKVAMDLIFKGLNVPRDMGGEKVRITSLGNPFRSEEHRDRFGRPWRVDVWHMEYSDHILLFASTPTPAGLFGILHETGSGKLDTWLWDLRRVLDYVALPYTGRLKQWQAYLALKPERRPNFFKDIALDFEAGKRLVVRTPHVVMNLDARTHTLTPEDHLGLHMAFRRGGEGVDLDLRRLTYGEDQSDNYLVWIDHPKPLPGMAEHHAKSWKTFASGLHPYTRKPFANESRTDIAMVLDAFIPKGVEPKDAPSLPTLYLGRTGTVSEGTMKKLLDQVAAGFKPVK